MDDQEMFESLLAEDLLSDLDDEQAKAIIDALALMLYSDKDVGRDEVLEFQNLVTILPFSWDDPEEAKAYTDEAMKRASSWDDEEGDLDDVVNDIVDRMSEDTYVAVYELLLRVVMADDDRSESEDLMLEAFQDAFGLEADDIEAIEARV